MSQSSERIVKKNKKKIGPPESCEVTDINLNLVVIGTYLKQKNEVIG